MSMSELTVLNDFQAFCHNIKMAETTIKRIRERYHSITRRVNSDYWNSTSEVMHSLYVGSYGRGTCIYASDIDIIVELPWAEYFRYDSYLGNGQSALLAALRNCLLKTYSTSRIGADGQVVDINFFDGVKFEIVPSFKNDDDSYFYPDTNKGGSWAYMNPKIEMASFNRLNNQCNGNLKRLCQMLRSWKKENNVRMSGIFIDTTAYWFLQTYEYADKSYIYYDWLSRDYFRYLMDHADQESWTKPGYTGNVKREPNIKSAAEIAYNQALEAINYFSKGNLVLCKLWWRKIYGAGFPLS